MSWLLDTNVCIAWLKGLDGALREKIASKQPGEVHLCSVVKAELIFGARKSRQVSDNLRRLEHFFAALPSLPFDDHAAAQYGVVRAQLEQSGSPIGPNDLLIAAISLSTDSTLVTRNDAEFRRVTGLRLEVW